MSKINANVADYLSQIETLTNTNLQILKTINDSFFTKKNHLIANVDESSYVIPSFISLENKINMLQENFENLVKAPESGEAYFNFDGNTRSIEVRKYNYTPDSITLPTVTSYKSESNDIFKDFLTPVPFINLELPNIPNDIVEVNVKKIVAKSAAVNALFKDKLKYTVESVDDNGNPVINTHYNQSTNHTYGNISKLLTNYIDGTDYVEYDTIYRLPMHENIGTASYVIESVVSDVIDDDLNELITLKLRNNLTDNRLSNTLTYRLFNETIEKPLKVGDELVNYNGTGKVVITNVRPNTNTITVRVVNGEYLNFLGTDSYDTNNDADIHDLSKLRFYSSVDFGSNKHIKIPLEEDQFVFVAVAVVNSRMNIQSSWGTGIMVDVYSLTNVENVPFKTYYDANVKNIGDALFEITSNLTSTITSLPQHTFEKMTEVKPVINVSDLSVMRINSHLDNSTNIINIRNAYNHKKNAETTLADVQSQIDTINRKLATISFNDTNNTRINLTAQLSNLNSQKIELLNSINGAINTITLNANNSEVPIENSKYRIRGFYVPNFSAIDNININDHVIGLQIQYRYKNSTMQFGSATSINNNDNTYIFSDWNTVSTSYRLKKPVCNDGIYTYEYEASNENKNEPSYNQIDIPITQGETVDIRVRVVYDYGQPYSTMTSSWSNIVNVEFPTEYMQDVSILSIIEENNKDIETSCFNSMFESTGVNKHISNSVTDQNTTFYHTADNIASGFYTDERRIIPLKDKLLAMANDIASLKTNLLGLDGQCKIYISHSDLDTEIYSDRDNFITLESYNNFSSDSSVINGYVYSNGVVSTILNLTITNAGDSAMKLYSIFPGNRDVIINNTASTYVNKNNYCSGDADGVLFKYRGSNNSMLQTQNQFITFRINDSWTGNPYYATNATISSQNLQNSKEIQNVELQDKLGMVVYPLLDTKHGMCIDSDDVKTYLTINPGEEIVIPIYCEYVATESNTSIEKTLSFDVRTSLYSDPVNYTFKIIGKNVNSVSDVLISNNKKQLTKNTTAWGRVVNTLKTAVGYVTPVQSVIGQSKSVKR